MYYLDNIFLSYSLLTTTEIWPQSLMSDEMICRFFLSNGSDMSYRIIKSPQLQCGIFNKCVSTYKFYIIKERFFDQKLHKFSSAESPYIIYHIFMMQYQNNGNNSVSKT